MSEERLPETPPAVEPAADAAPAESAVTPPAPEPTPVADAPLPGEPPHTDTPSLLTQPPAADVPAETPPPAPAEEPTAPIAEPAAPAAPVVEPEPIVYEPLTLPDGIQLDNARAQEFDALLTPLRVPPESRQALADMHIAAMQQYAEAVASEQQRIFAQTRRGWRDEVLADENLGGAGHETAIGACMRIIDEFVPASRRKAFDEMLVITGAGDHPEMLRMLYNISKKLDAPSVPTAPTGPAPDRGGANGRRRMREMYDHPTSQRN